MTKIRDLASSPRFAVYQRAGGEVYAKLNDAFHVKAILEEDGSVTGNGSAEKLDPNEDVVVLAGS